jgi:hypothetical protein
VRKTSSAQLTYGNSTFSEGEIVEEAAPTTAAATMAQVVKVIPTRYRWISTLTI